MTAAIRRILAAPLDAHWDTDAIGRILFGPPTVGHLLAGILIGSTIAIALSL